MHGSLEEPVASGKAEKGYDSLSQETGEGRTKGFGP